MTSNRAHRPSLRGTEPATRHPPGDQRTREGDVITGPDAPRPATPASVLSGVFARPSVGREVVVQLDVPARMRDGTTLRSNIFRPGARGPWPVLLVRLPYGKDLPLVGMRHDPVQAAGQGFIVVVQDTRGRFASEGEWEPFRHERTDGYDAVEWAAKLPGSNGHVGMLGESYFGNTQWLAALQHPPSLGAIAPAHTWLNPLNGLFARAGAAELGLALAWSLRENIAHVQRLPCEPAERERRMWALVDEWDKLAQDGYWALPVHHNEVLRRHGLTRVSLMRGIDDPEFARWPRVTPDHTRIHIPTFLTAGWYDIFIQDTLDTYQDLRSLDRDARLIVGPWTHIDVADPIGDLCFGLRASRFGVPVHHGFDLNELMLIWFRRQLGQNTDEALPETRVRYFVMGKNVWRDAPSWPPDAVHLDRWFLRNGGSLTRDVPAGDEKPSTFTYDPTDPTPTVGGATILSSAFPAGPRDQQQLEVRPDVLVFTSEPLRTDLEVTGRVRVLLHAMSSAESTDWVARLCDVYPDGRSLNICDGIVRVGTGAASCRRHEVDLWSTSNLFRRGHRLRVHIASSSFPRWDRNLNTGNQHGKRSESAAQQLHHCSERPSFIELPVLAS